MKIVLELFLYNWFVKIFYNINGIYMMYIEFKKNDIIEKLYNMNEKLWKLCKWKNIEYKWKLCNVNGKLKNLNEKYKI